VEAHTASATTLPPLDEITFQQLLEAAYVIQQQREAEPPPRPERPVIRIQEEPAAHTVDASEVLALIVETQEQLRTQVRDLPTAGKLIAQRLEQVTNAAGVAVAVIREDHLEFCAATGVLSSLAGSTAPVGDSLPELLHANSWSSVELAIRHDAKCPIVFPIFHEGRTTGLLHLSFPDTEKLEEHQIRTCQVMAGLMGEAISRVSELHWKQTLAAERTTMMEILERLRPQLERLAAESKAEGSEKAETVGTDFNPPLAMERPVEFVVPEPVSTSVTSASYTCQQCGAHMKEDEIFCGQCGAPQLDLTTPLPFPGEEIASPSPELPKETKVQAPKAEPKQAVNSLPQKDVSLPPSLEQALAHLPSRDVVDRFRPRFHPLIEEEPAPVVEPDSENPPRDAQLRDGSITLQVPRHDDATPVGSGEADPELSPLEKIPEAPAQLVLQPAQAVGVQPDPITAPKAATATQKASPWSSAAQAHKWLKSLQTAGSPTRVWINKHRADLWVGVSVILLLLALSGWGSRSAIYGAAQTRVVQPSLTLFERVLVALDLAEPPPTQVYLGNPNARVWVDLHTALYYCQGADLYGKTPEGKFTSQRDAQLDQFEPAARTYCR